MCTVLLVIEGPVVSHHCEPQRKPRQSYQHIMHLAKNKSIILCLLLDMFCLYVWSVCFVCIRKCLVSICLFVPHSMSFMPHSMSFMRQSMSPMSSSSVFTSSSVFRFISVSVQLLSAFFVTGNKQNAVTGLLRLCYAN